MSYEEAIAYCNQYNKAIKKEDKTQKEIERLYEKKEKLMSSVVLPSTALSGMPSAHSQTDRMAGYVSELEPIEAEIDRLRTIRKDQFCETLMIRRELLQTFDALPEQQSELMKQRYIYGDGRLKEFDEISDIMSYTTRHIRRIHKQAMEEIMKKF